MDRRVGLLVALGCGVLLLLALPAIAGEETENATEQDAPEFEFVDCLGFGLAVEDSETDAVAVESENLTAVNASVRSTEDVPPGPNGTFRIESERLEFEDLCMYERIDENGSRVELIGVENENSTIFGPKLKTSYDYGVADRLVIETLLTAEEFVQELL